jgi:hypothetical protein
MAKGVPIDEEVKYKSKSETNSKTQSYEDIMKELIEEGIRIERPRVPKLIRDLQEAIDDTSTRGSGIIWRLQRSMDLRALPILSEALLKAKKCIVRTRAAMVQLV